MCACASTSQCTYTTCTNKYNTYALTHMQRLGIFLGWNGDLQCAVLCCGASTKFIRHCLSMSRWLLADSFRFAHCYAATVIYRFDFICYITMARVTAPTGFTSSDGIGSILGRNNKAQFRMSFVACTWTDFDLGGDLTHRLVFSLFCIFPDNTEN